MKKINTVIATLLFGIFALSSCWSKAKTMSIKFPIEPETPLVLDKLVGTWKSEDGKSYERWTKNPDGSYHSSVYMLKEKDTFFVEQADIFKRNNHWVFENKVAGQNDGKKVRFTSDIANESKIRFTNPAHDFPNEINYTVPNANVVNAFIVGKNEKGGIDTIPFNYSRVE